MSSFTGSSEDRLAIRELLERYADAIFCHDAGAWGDCWSENGVWHFAGTVLTGRDTIVATWREAMASFKLADFRVQPGAIEVTGECARARSWSREFFVLNDGDTRHISGRYDDDLVRTDTGWRFAVRRYRLLHDSATT